MDFGASGRADFLRLAGMALSGWLEQEVKRKRPQFTILPGGPGALVSLRDRFEGHRAERKATNPSPRARQVEPKGQRFR